MPIIHAIVLGLVQGLSEFLPISSSGHLLLVPWLFDWHDFDDRGTEKAFDVALHIGTLFAAIVYFRRDLVRYTAAGLRLLARRDPAARADGRVAWMLLLSSVPAAAVGALFEERIDENLGTPTIIAVSLIGFGLLLGLSDTVRGSGGPVGPGGTEGRRVEDLRVRDALVVGAAQALALNPGTSRSGITMTAARGSGFSRDAAARLSFLMMVPVTAGAVVFKLAGLASDGLDDDLRIPMVVGVVTSGVSGWLAVWGLLRLVRTRSFAPFVGYRVALGAAVLVVVAAGWR